MNIKNEYKFYIVYKTINLINSKIYVGRHCTDNLNDNYLGSGGTYFQNSLTKYGRENFKREILECCVDFNNLLIREIYWIKKLNSTDPKVGYNLCDTIKTGTPFKKGMTPWNKGLPEEKQPNFGRIVSEKTKEKVKKTKKENPYSHSKERKEKISKIKTGVKLNLSETQLQRRRETGSFIPSEETRKLMSHNNCRYWKNKPMHNRTPIYQVNPETGNIIKIWDCIKEAKINFAGNISACLKYLKGTASGFIWVYERDLDKVLKIIYYNNIPKKQNQGGKCNLIKNNDNIYFSLSEASSKTGISSYNIKKYCNNSSEWSFVNYNEFIKKLERSGLILKYR